MTTSKIEAELLEVTGFKPKGKDRQADLTGIHDAVADLKDDAWNDLSEPAQKWCNDNGKLIKKNAEADILEFPDLEDEEGDEGEGEAEGEHEADPAAASEEEPVEEGEAEEAGEEGEDEDDGEEKEDPKPRKVAAKSNKKVTKAPKAAAKKPDKKPAPKAAKKDEDKPRRAAGPKGTGVKVDIKKAILRKPKITVDELEELLAEKHEKPSRFTIAAIRAEFRHSLVVLEAQGWLTKPITL